jgi:hypothetical protein
MSAPCREHDDVLKLLSNAAMVLDNEANLLDDWAAQSLFGGWSTHQVEPQRKRADELRRESARIIVALAKVSK